MRPAFALLALLALLLVPGGAARARGESTLRLARSEPSLAPDPASVLPGAGYEWEFAATRMDAIPTWVLRAAASVPVAIVDTGADLSAPDLAAKHPLVHSVTGPPGDVTDVNGHGTFVASIAAGSPENDDGMAGFAGDAPLLIVQAGSQDGLFAPRDEEAAIVYAVDHGARVINLSIGGTLGSAQERRGVDYAIRHGVLLVAAVGNEALSGNPVEYPAALLQLPGSNGVGGAGLAVGGADPAGQRAWFSNSGSWISLVAPAVNVFAAVSGASPERVYPRVALPGARAGLYGYESGTSFAAPQVSGAAALVWAANPLLSAAQVADVVERSASGHGQWNPDTGFGLLDGAAAVAAATAALPAGLSVAWVAVALEGRELRAQLSSSGAASVAGRTLLVERTRDTHWRRVGSGTTGRHGAASWTVRPGFRYRVRFGGAPDLTRASSLGVG